MSRYLTHRGGLSSSSPRGPVRPAGVFELIENPDQSTQVRFVLALKAARLWKLLAPMITPRMQREVDALDNLKAILERAP